MIYCVDLGVPTKFQMYRQNTEKLQYGEGPLLPPVLAPVTTPLIPCEVQLVLETNKFICCLLSFMAKKNNN